MSSKRPSRGRPRDPRYTKSIGTPPVVGRRVVVNDRVRIEWTEDGRRRSRTIGPNDAATRKLADEELASILATMRTPDDDGGTMDEQHAGDEHEAPEVEVDGADGTADDAPQAHDDAYGELKDVVESVVDFARRGALAVIEVGDAAYDKLLDILND
ncbi:MAG TPA: hypothetical protein VGA22_10560 [Gemmatimonadales bacterium]|jgi:hypothetical protein